MKAHHKIIAKFMMLVVAAVMCGLPELAQAQQESQQQNGTTASPQNGTMVDPSQSQSGTNFDPAKGPLQPVPAQEPQATETPAPQSSNESLPTAPAPQQKQEQVQQPLGAATAEGVTTVGGAASRPAGMAIAPDKQKDRRSLLIKLGLIAAAGVAVGTVAALSKGTSAKPK
jgi:hypothetical protein